jgi:hypothetical protein
MRIARVAVVREAFLRSCNDAGALRAVKPFLLADTLTLAPPKATKVHVKTVKTSKRKLGGTSSEEDMHEHDDEEYKPSKEVAAEEVGAAVAAAEPPKKKASPPTTIVATAKSIKPACTTVPVCCLITRPHTCNNPQRSLPDFLAKKSSKPTTAGYLSLLTIRVLVLRGNQ